MTLDFHGDFFELAPDLFISVDVKSRKIRACNQTTLDFLGYQHKQQLVGKDLFFIYHDDGLPQVSRLYDRFIQTGILSNSRVLLCHCDGHPLDAILSSTAIRDENGAVAFSRSVLRCGRSVDCHDELLEELIGLRMISEQLSEREQTVLDLVCAGRPNKSIARKLIITERAVEMVRSRLVMKFGVNSSNELVYKTSRLAVLEQVIR